MKFQDFKEEIKKHLSDYKENTLNIKEFGIWKKNKEKYQFPHILPVKEKQKNILEPYRDDFFNNPRFYSLKLHQYFHHLNSSQAMCINVFYPLFKERKLELLFSVLETDNQEIDYKTVDFEKTSQIESHYGFRPTSFDFYFATKEQSKYYFEIKYTENGFGKAKNDQQHQCKFNNVYKPCLDKNIKFPYNGMELFFENYQIIRNLIHIEEKSYVIFIYPEENIKIKESSEKAKSDIIIDRLKSNFICLTWEKLLSEIDKEKNKLPMLCQENLIKFKEKYLLKM